MAHSPASIPDDRGLRHQKMAPLLSVPIAIHSHWLISYSVGQSDKKPLYVLLPPCSSVINQGISPAPERMISQFAATAKAYCSLLKYPKCQLACADPPRLVRNSRHSVKLYSATF